MRGGKSIAIRGDASERDDAERVYRRRLAAQLWYVLMATVIVTSSAPVWVIAADFCVGMMAMSAKANDCSVVISPRINKDVGSAHTSTAASSWTRAWRTGSVKKNSERMPCLPMTCSERASERSEHFDQRQRPAVAATDRLEEVLVDLDKVREDADDDPRVDVVERADGRRLHKGRVNVSG
jgi:hypothetical protein